MKDIGIVAGASLANAADAIRLLRGESDTYTPDEFGEKIIDKIPTEEVTDDIVSVTDAAAYPAEGLEFGIEPVQDLHGYDKPWPAGGGKNLVDESMLLTATGWSKTNTGYYTGGVSALNDTFGPSTDGFCPNTTFKANTQYTISLTNYVESGGYINIRIYYTDETTDGMQLSTNTTVTNSTFTTAANKTVQKITTGYIQSSTGQVAWKDFQVEEGSTATSYEPYSNICPISGWTGVQGKHSGADTTQYTSIPITFPTEAGTVYGGKVDVVNGKLTVDRVEVDLGTLKWNKFGTSNYYFSTIPNFKSDFPCQCSSYPYSPYSTGSSRQDKTINSSSYYGVNSVNVLDSSYSTPEEFKTAVSGVQLVYKLATSIEYDITPQQVQMLLGDNNVWCDTGDTTLEYKVDLGRYIEKLQAVQATPQLSLSRQAVSLDAAGDVEISADEPAELPVEEDTEAESTESEIQVKEPDTLEKRGR